MDFLAPSLQYTPVTDDSEYALGTSLILLPLRRAGDAITLKRLFTLKQLQFHFYFFHGSIRVRRQRAGYG